mmetsp:Transcript_10211/g.17196  ORF Transcript_10211/g.17196 Transcript_10211/m.17196 type:complete len:124 (+) Transcript_10211:2079-2450(+)
MGCGLQTSDCLVHSQPVPQNMHPHLGPAVYDYERAQWTYPYQKFYAPEMASLLPKDDKKKKKKHKKKKKSSSSSSSSSSDLEATKPKKDHFHQRVQTEAPKSLSKSTQVEKKQRNVPLELATW